MTAEMVAKIRHVLAQGDALAERGDRRAAASYYKAALQGAQSMGAQLPDAIRPELQRAVQAVQDLEQAYVAHLTGAVQGPDGAAPTGRFGRAIDIAVGRTRPYLQEPRQFYFPELPQKAFYDRGDFPWAAGLEAATAAIRTEALEVFRTHQSFQPYLTAEGDHLQDRNHPLIDNDDWGAFYLWKDGERVAANAARCPATMAALDALPLCQVPGALPSVLFSLLRPGAHIPPHNGLLNTRLIGHLGLVVPDGCALRVGNETRSWQEGEVMVFDDSVEHEAWNKSDAPRLILLFDVWRPELTDAERGQVANLLQAIRSFGG